MHYEGTTCSVCLQTPSALSISLNRCGNCRNFATHAYAVHRRCYTRKRVCCPSEISMNRLITATAVHTYAQLQPPFRTCTPYRVILQRYRLDEKDKLTACHDDIVHAQDTKCMIERMPDTEKHRTHVLCGGNVQSTLLSS